MAVGLTWRCCCDPMPIADELELDARKLLARNGYSVTRVYDVDAEGEVTVIAFVAGVKEKTAYTSVNAKGHESVVVRDDWRVP